MLRPFLVLQAMVALSLVGVYSPSVSKASPSDGAAPGSCSFVLTPPRVVQVSGSNMVLAMLKPKACTIDGIPNGSVVCVSIDGEASPGQCGAKVGPEPALVYYPYQPGSTYVVRGRGCADIFDNPIYHNTGPISTICQSLGPMSFTL